LIVAAPLGCAAVLLRRDKPGEPAQDLRGLGDDPAGLMPRRFRISAVFSSPRGSRAGRLAPRI
jgi:hypothetical protein